MPVQPSPYYESNTWANKSPLKWVTGAEQKRTVVLAYSTVTADSMSRRRLSPGTFLVKIDTGHLSGKYGPYLKTASDGRQTPAEGEVVFSWEAHDVTLGNRAIAGIYAQATFDKSELTMGGYSLHGASLTSLKGYFPSCVFDD